MSADAEHMARALVVAERVSARATEALGELDREMKLMKWPAEFRAIMWEAVADLASRRANEARNG